jgi:hypothetical protein
MKLSPDLRIRCDKVLDAIAAAEADPSATDLLNAPVLDVWRPLISAHGHVVLWGSVTGYPHLDDDNITTSRLIAIGPDSGWARTASRWYRLGRPFTKLEADLAAGMGAKETGADFLEFDLPGFLPIRDQDLLAELLAAYIRHVREIDAADLAGSDEGC